MSAVVAPKTRNVPAMTRGPQPIGDILAELMARNGFAGLQSAETLERAWKEAAGALVAKYTRVGALRRGKLEVIVANSTLVQELTYQKPALLKAVNRLLPDQHIQDVRFRVGEVC